MNKVRITNAQIRYLILGEVTNEESEEREGAHNL